MGVVGLILSRLYYFAGSFEKKSIPLRCIYGTTVLA